MAQPDLGLFGRVMGVSDYKRMQEEFDMKKAQEAQAAKLGALQLQKFEKELAAGPDLKVRAQNALYNHFATGQPLGLEDRAAIETLAAMEGSKTEYKPDDFGNIRAVTTPNAYQQFLSGGEKKQTSQQTYAAPQTFESQLDNSPEALANALGVSREDILKAQSDVANMKPVLMDGPPQLDETAQEMMAQEDAYSKLDPEVAASPYGRKAIFEQQLKNDAARGQAAVDVVKKGEEVTATKTAEYEAAKPKKLDAISRISQNMVEAEKTFNSLPQGMIQQFGKYVASDVFGFPSEMADAVAKVNVLLPAITSDLKQLVREPGEGTFTDADQALIQRMAFDPSAPLSAKIAAYNALKGVMGRYEQSLGRTTSQKSVEEVYRLYSGQSGN